MASRVLPVLFIVAVPLLLVTVSVTWAVNDMSLYSRGFDKYNVPAVTGIDKDGLMEASRQIRGYFNSTGEPLDITATIFGEERTLFNAREVVHMRDVKHLIWGVYSVGLASAVYILGFVIGGYLIHRRAFTPRLSRYLIVGSGLTVALVVVVGLISLVGFEGLFRFFHEVSFANDFWQLDPRRDFLVMMFPQGFWLDATLFVAGITVGLAVVVAGSAGCYLVLKRRTLRKAGSVLMQNPSNPVEL